MVAIDRETTVVDGVTLVTAVVAGDDVPRRVRIANNLDGPVWPPRSAGRPEAGWDEEGCTLRVPGDGRVAVGYASPADPVDPPVTVAAVEPAGDGSPGLAPEGPGQRTERHATDAAIRALGDPAPPRDAVPLPAPADPNDDGDGSGGTGTGGDRQHDADGAEERIGAEGPRDDHGTRSAPAVPAAVAAWLDDVEERLELVEGVADADSVPATTGALAAAGGAEGVRAAADETSATAAPLRRIAGRAGRLADRAEAVDLPEETLRALS